MAFVGKSIDLITIIIQMGIILAQSESSQIQIIVKF